MNESQRIQFRTSLIASVFLVPAAVCAILQHVTIVRFSIGFVVGTIYALLFEWVFHRYALHGVGSLAQGHHLHHESSGKINVEEHINFFSGDAFSIVILFTANSVPWLIAEFFVRWNLFPGALTSFVIYLIFMEVVHRGIHLGARWVPESWSRHHLIHHGHSYAANENTNYNIFLPIFDWIFGTKQDSSVQQLSK